MPDFAGSKAVTNLLEREKIQPPPRHTHRVIPAKAGIQFQAANTAPRQNWIPASAGMTRRLLKNATTNRALHVPIQSAPRTL